MTTIRQFLGGQTLREVGTVSHKGTHYTVRLRDRGMGCAVGEIREDGSRKWRVFTGRFGNDATVQHFVAHTARFSLSDGAHWFLTDTAMAALGTLEDMIVCGKLPPKDPSDTPIGGSCLDS